MERIETVEALVGGEGEVPFADLDSSCIDTVRVFELTLRYASSTCPNGKAAAATEPR